VPHHDVLFPFGRLVATPGALNALASSGESPVIYLARHLHGDWGDLNEEDSKANESALIHGDRLFSSYKLKDGSKLWIITEADRSSTTLLLPSEY
jgi:hypothetical protein